jgi:hypothetical protein
MASKKGKPLVFSMNPKYHLHLLAAMWFLPFCKCGWCKKAL